MEWYASVVIVRIANRVGSGVLLDQETILTAAHVVDPDGSGAPPAAEMIVEVPWAGYAAPEVRAVRIHPSWAPGNLLADFAGIRIAAMSGLGLSLAPPDLALESFLYGYPGAPNSAAAAPSSFQSGFLKRDAFKLYSDGFHVASGMSGSPFVQASGGETRVVGLATWDADIAQPGAFKGLPLDSAHFETFWPPAF